MGTSTINVLLFTLLLLILSACNGGEQAGFGALEDPTGTSDIPCEISTTTPEATSVVVSATVGTKTVFNIVPSTSSCNVNFLVNGVKVNTTSANFIELDSASLNSGSNVVRVEATNSLGSDFSEWTVIKNAPPTCSRAVPTAAAINMINTASQSYTVNATTEPGETLDFTWLLDGVASSTLAETITASTASQALFSPNVSLNGVRTVAVEVSDGLDKVTCSWTTNVSDDCSVTAKLPDVVSQRMAAVGASNLFSVTTSTSTCLVNWTLNGIDLPGNGVSQTITSLDLNSGSNFLKAEVSSTSGVTSKSWTVVKNTPPSCAQSPGATGAQTSVGTGLPLQASIVDVNNDNVTWSWAFNGIPVTGGAVSVVNTSNSSTATFTPTESNVGFNTFLLALNDGYDTTSCNWNVQVSPNCNLSSPSPVASSLTVPSTPTNINVFSVVPSNSTCNISWSLNGISLGVGTPSLNLLSSFLATTNTLVATVSNGSSNATHTWNILKNSPPTCSTLSPSNPSFVFGVGATQAFTANITDINDTHTLTYDWKLDGVTPNPLFFASTNSSRSTTGTWTSTYNQMGSHNLTVSASDSFDTTVCSWTPEVLRNCSATSSSPSGATLRVANLASTTTSFGAVANDPSCNIVWKLNGSNVLSSDNFYSVLSSALTTSNTVEAVMSNAVSTTTRSWSVTKNSPPACGTKVPASSSGNSVNVNESIYFSVSPTDANTDNLTYDWKFNGNTSALFTLGIPATSAHFSPGLPQVGDDQQVSVNLSDTYDITPCSWQMDVIDPDSATILGVTPSAENPVIVLSGGSRQLNVSASGTGISYSWKINNQNITGNNTNSLTVNATDLSVKTNVQTPETASVTVSDIYGNSDSHVFNLRRNAPPVVPVDGYTPNVSGVSVYRLGINQNLAFSVSATDPNNDSLSYSWKLNGGNSTAITANNNSATFNPDGNVLLVGNHTVSVVISDGYETTTQSWLVVVNYLSDECNELYNSSPTGGNGGKVCTLVGSPSMGNGLNILEDQTLFKGRPTNVIEIEPGIYAVSENLNHTVFIYNSNLTGNFEALGKIVEPGTIEVVLGTGALGKTADANNPFSSGDYAFQSVAAPIPVEIPIFKLNEPRGLAWDPVDEILYISDRNNNRVIGVNSEGRVSRILGHLSATNSTAFNTDGSFGNTQSCSSPMGLTISQDYLYVACYGQNAIKRVNINTSSGDYLKAYTIIGRLNGSGATVTTAWDSAVQPWALPDGVPGPSTSATAYTNGPIELAVDANGVVYWTDFLQNYHGGKIRAFNPNAVDYTLVSAGSPELTSPAALAFRAVPLQTAPVFNYLISYHPANSPTGFPQYSQAVSVADGSFTGGSFLLGYHARMVTNGCHGISVSLRNSAGTAISLAANLTVTLSSSLAGSFFSDNSCTSSLPSGQFTFTGGSGQFNRMIFFKPTTAGTHNITASGGGVTTVSNATGYASPIVAATSTAASRIRIYGPRRFSPLECIPVEFQLTDASNIPAVPSASMRFGVDTNSVGNYYSSSTCTGAPVYDLTFSTSEHTKYLFFKRQIILPAGMVSTVAGYDYSFPASYNDYANNVKVGEIRFNGSANGQNGTLGLGIISNSVTGQPSAIIYGSIQSTVHYLNFSNTTYSVGSAPYTRTISPRRSEILVGGANSLGAPTGISAGYNGENQDSWGTQINQAYGLTVTSDGQKIIFADYNNLRVRSSDLNFDGSNYTSNQITTLIGAGRFRYRQNVTSIQAPSVSLYSPYKVEFSNGYLYFSELNNHWIRRVNVTTGIVENVVGLGLCSGSICNSFTEGQDANAEGISFPRGFKVVAYPNSASPTNYVLFYAQSAVGYRCLVRAVNVSGPQINNFFGVGTLQPGKVKTVAGDTAKVCGAWATVPANTEGMAATSARLNMPEDVAFINGELYIILNGDHCIVKVDANGVLTRPQGTSSCVSGLPGSNTDAIISSMTTRYPRSFSTDMGKPGNYFFVDNYDGTPGYVRYINTLTSNISFNANSNFVAARASTSAPFVVKTIYSHTSPSGNSYLSGVASWSNSTTSVGSDDRVCWTAGRLDDSTLGDHAIFCAKRSLSDDPQRVAGPSSASLMRAGSPLGLEQEKIDRLSATFFAPYGIAFDDDGNIYVTEYNNHVIRMIRRWW